MSKLPPHFYSHTKEKMLQSSSRMGRASRNLFHEDFEESALADRTEVVDDVFVFQSGMQRDLLV